MADKKTVEVAFATTADTSGSDKIVEAIEKIEQKTEDAGEAAEKSGFDKLFDQQRALAAAGIMKELAAEVGKLVGQFARSDEGKQLFSGMSEGALAFGEVAAGVGSDVAAGFATGGPVGAALGGLLGLVRAVGNEFMEADRRIAESNAAWNDAQQAHIERMKERQIEAANTTVEEAYKAETRALRAQNQELENANKLLKARQDLTNAKADLADKKALAAGADPADVAMGAIQRDFAAKAAAVDQQVKDAYATVQEIGGRLVTAEKAFDEIKRVQGTSSDAAKEAKANADNIESQLNESVLQLKGLEERLPLKKEELAVELESKLADVFSEVERRAATKYEGIISAIEEGGGVLAESNKAGLDQMKALVADQRVTEGERQSMGDAVAKALAGLRGDIKMLSQASIDHSEAQKAISAQAKQAADLARQAREMIGTPLPHR